VAALDARFDELGSETIEMDEVVCELDPLAMAVGVYPIAQSAYHLSVSFHAPALRTGPDLVAISAAMSFAPGGVFSPEAAFAQFCVALYDAVIEPAVFDCTACFARIVKALTRVKYECIEIYEHDDDDLSTKRWTGFVTRQEREVAKRRTASGNALHFSKDELQALVREIRLFGTLSARNDMRRHMLTLTPCEVVPPVCLVGLDFFLPNRCTSSVRRTRKAWVTQHHRPSGPPAWLPGRWV
jgi:hypothetical protein